MNTKHAWFAECLGTAGLLMAVVGSGIMGERLADGNMAVALLANSIATGASLFVLIFLFAGISGAHFNPIVTFSELLLRKKSARQFLGYVTAQLTGAVLGVWTTHYIFGIEIFQLSTRDRSGPRFFISEILATAGLLFVVRNPGKSDPKYLPFAISLYITAAYWFTSSTAFSNPAATIARSLSNTFAGIESNDVLPAIGAQILAALIVYCSSTFVSRTVLPIDPADVGR
jgi:glycerol uptake facilitator-like aquaporin